MTELTHRIAGAGFPVTVWQTDDGSATLVVALSEGGLNGPVALMGPDGVAVLAHGDVEPEECYTHERGCEPCAVLARVADTASVAVGDDGYAAWAVTTAKELAKAIATHPHHA